jgi:hypothetical protein
MRKISIALLMGVMLAHSSAANAVMPATPTISSVVSKSSDGAGLAEAAAEIKFSYDPSATGVVYSAAAVATGESTHFGSTPSCEAASSTCTSIVSGLNGGQQYSFYATAVDTASGTKSTSAAKIFEAQSIPTAPVAGTPVAKGSEVTLSWTVPTNDGGLAIDAYTITGGNAPISVAGNLVSQVVKNLSYGTSYSFKIVAHNALGNSAQAQFAAVTPTAAPTAPEAPQVKADGTSIVANWTAPSSNGSAITAYKVYLVDATTGQDVSAPTSATGTTATLANLTSGTYKVQVVATNGVGDSSRSPESSAVPVTSGIAPAITTANIRGIAQIGQTLTAVAGGVTGTPTPTASYQWKRAGSAITGATGSTYVLVTADLNKAISVTITETNGVGTAASITSDVTSPVAQADAPPTASGISIAGTAKVGQTLTANVSGASGYPVPTTAYQWYLNGAAVSNATGSTYQVRLADLDRTVSVRAVLTNSQGSLALTSTGTASVQPADVAPAVSSVAIVGVARVGQTLEVLASGLTGSPVPTAAYQWRRGAATASISTSARYTVQSADLGKTLTVRVTYTNAAGNVVVFSQPTAVVLAATSNPTSVTVTVTGTATVGQVLNAIAIAAGSFPTSTFTWLWKRNGSAIAGATAASYTLTSDDLGAVITASATSSVGSVTGVSGGTSAVVAPSSGSSGGGSSSGSSGNGGGTVVTPVVPTPSVDTRPVTPTQDTRPVNPSPVNPTEDIRPVTPTPVAITQDKPAVQAISVSAPTVVAVTLPTSGGGAALTGISITVPAGLVAEGSKLSVAPAVTPAEASAGLVTLSVVITDASGKRVTNFEKPLSLVLGKLDLSGLTLAYSEDGLVWKHVNMMAGVELPEGVTEGYFVDSLGNVVVLTKHLTYFGVKKTQTSISASTSVGAGYPGESVQINTSGGSGSGQFNLIVNTPATCTLFGLQVKLTAPGACAITVAKNGDSTYLDASSAPLNILAKAPMLQISGKATSRKVIFTAGPASAGATAIFEMRKVGSSTWKLLKQVKLSASGSYKGTLVIPPRASIRVKIGVKGVASARVS